MEAWHQRDSADVCQQLGCDPHAGLDDAEVAARLAAHGPNELVGGGVEPAWRIFVRQLASTMVVLLVAAAAVSFALGDVADAAVILVIVAINATLGFAQEFRAERAMIALRQMTVPLVRVRRASATRLVSQRELVPGDLLELEAGNLVPADARVLESAGLRTQEAPLTGEAEAVTKDPARLQPSDVPLGDRANMVYMGTAVVQGRGLAVVTTTGMGTELGRVAGMIQAVNREPTPMQRRLDRLARQLALAALALVAIVFVLGLARGEDARLMFLTAISMAVAAVPEGLPAVVTLTLALGAQRMLRRRALIRRLPAVETLGSVTTICSDKTGTLTENRMTVRVLDVAGHRIDLVETLHHGDAVVGPADELPATLTGQPALVVLLAGAVLCNDAILVSHDGREQTHAVGDPTEGALVVAAARLGIWPDALRAWLPRLSEVPFDAQRRRMTTAHRVDGGPLPTGVASNLAREVGGAPFVSVTKGAVDGLVDTCASVLVDQRILPLDDGWRRRIVDANDALARDGMRVLGVAFRTLECLPSDALDLERELTFVGMIGLLDPPRPAARDAVRACLAAGIRPVMITGDHPLTARTIARDLGIDRSGAVLTGAELKGIAPDALREAVREVQIYARVEPEHKLKIVQALRERGEVVAMTGDGVNDAPALRQADIGVAMGITGTEVAKEAADMVLLDDNFATIVAAVEEGRAIFDNIRKFVRYLVTTNTAELALMLLAPLLGMPLPLLPLQILWVNLLTDGLPALALSVEPAEPGTMTRPPDDPRQGIVGGGMGWRVLWMGMVMALLALGVGYLYWRGDRPEWQTMIFTILTLSQLSHVLGIRSVSESLFRVGLASNLPLLGAVLVMLGLQLAVVYLPVGRAVLGIRPLGAVELAVCLAASTVAFWITELEKLRVRRRGSGHAPTRHSATTPR
ncbi:MAG TPA: cation-translocating P-type ATPase [Thermomicrobiaceae bacterium]|nr:cation-translocating P-type ATPase [Thermomicrobiaceae bacterium]